MTQMFDITSTENPSLQTVNERSATDQQDLELEWEANQTGKF